MEQIHLETIFKHHKDKEVTGSSQQGFMKGKSCLTYLTSFYKKMAGLMRRLDVAYLDFSKAFNTISLNTLIGNPRKCRLDKWTMRQIGKRLNSRLVGLGSADQLSASHQ